MRTRITRRERAGKDPTEHVEAVRLMRTVRLHVPLHPVLDLLYHVPNGGWRHTAVAGKLKAEGQKAGVLDYCLPAARQGFHGLYLELKAMGGRPSDKQLAFADAVRAEGYRVEFCKGWEDAWGVLTDYLGIPNRLLPSGLVAAPARGPSPTLPRPLADPKPR